MSYKSVKEVVTLLVKYDFKQVRQTGSHMVFTNGNVWLLFQITGVVLRKALITTF